MVVSPAERETLLRQVHARVRRRVSAAEVRDAVDRVLGALPGASASPVADVVVVVSAMSTPDLASRFRAALAGRAQLTDTAVATEGRHTVMVARVSATDAVICRDVAAQLGASCSQRAAVA